MSDLDGTPCSAGACFEPAATIGQLRTGSLILAVPLCWEHAVQLDRPSLDVDWWDAGV